MVKQQGDSIQVTIGDNAKNIAAGKNIEQTVTEQHEQIQITEADMKAIHELFVSLKSDIEKEVSSELRESAIERVDELEETVTAKKPDFSTMEYVKKWFVKKLPTFAGKVMGVLVNPIVGKVVEASGEIAATELKERFGKVTS